MYAFKCGNDSKNKLKGISKTQSKDIKFEEYKKCLDGEEYQEECDNYIIRSINLSCFSSLLLKLHTEAKRKHLRRNQHFFWK